MSKLPKTKSKSSNTSSKRKHSKKRSKNKVKKPSKSGALLPVFEMSTNTSNGVFV